MMQMTVNEAFESLDIINEIPYNVYNEIDIITAAPAQFLKIVAAIEQTTDKHEKAKLALDYLKDNNGFLKINFNALRACLKEPSSCSIAVWRQLYLLERSIPARAGNKWTWVERLKVFCDTYSLEHAVLKQTIEGLPGILKFTRNSGDHENLCAGPGSFATDFYCWDKELSKNHAFVEFKYWSDNNIDAAKEYYADKRYDARYILLFTADHKYYLIDYDTNTIIEQSNLPIPELLIW